MLGLLGPEHCDTSSTAARATVAKFVDEVRLDGIAKCSATQNVDVVDVPRDAVLASAGHEATPPNYEALWKQYKTKFRKVYNDVDEETVSFWNFKLNAENIRATKRDKDLTFHLGLNELTDSTRQEEFAAHLGRTLEQIVEQNVDVPVQPRMSPRNAFLSGLRCNRQSGATGCGVRRGCA